MATGEFTLRIPAALPQDRSPVVFTRTLGTNNNVFEWNRHVTPDDFTPAGLPITSGQNQDLHKQAITAFVTEADLLLFEGLFKWQQLQLKAKVGAGARLEWVDEVNILNPEPSPHSRTLLQTFTDDDGWEYGYGVYDVLITLPRGHREIVSTLSGRYYLISFGVEEAIFS